MRFSLNRQSDTPLYLQIETYFRECILSGNLAPETRLPAIRQLAADLGVNRITVENAFADLAADGLIYTRIGSGTFVQESSPLPALPQKDPSAPWPLWQQDALFSNPGQIEINTDNLFEETNHPHPISFAGGTGDPYLFPMVDFRKTMQFVLRRDGVFAFEYGDKKGYQPLRTTIAQVLASQGVQSNPDHILITGGSQQALALVAQLLLKPGETILVEIPTYSGALSLFRALHLRVVGIPLDEQGMRVDRLEKALQQYHPKLIYTIPNFQNPTGACLTEIRRRQLIAIADRYNIPVLEDDFVGDLRYDGRAQPALKALDPGGRVIYVSTFSKMLVPGLRVGYLMVEGPIYDMLVNFKRVNDLASSNLTQRALEAYVTVGRHQAHLRHSCQIYRKRRDAIVQAIHRFFPAGVEFEPPQGGLFIWARLPEGISADALLPLAMEEGVSFSPGRRFFLDANHGENFIRLNFAMHTPEEIEEGVKRIARAIKRLKTNDDNIL